MMNRLWPRSPGSKKIQMPYSQELPLNIVGASNFGRYKKISSEETFNMIVSDGCLVPFPGYKAVAEIAKEGDAREIYSSPKYKHMIVVIANAVFKINADLGVSQIGIINTFSGNVFIAENDRHEIAICDGLNIYIFDYINNTFQMANTPDFRPVYISYQDARFLAADGNSNNWRLSSVDNSLSWPSDFAHVGKLETKSSNTVAVVPLDRQLFVFGQTVIEPWVDVGYTEFPYQKSNFYNIDYGCVCPETIASSFSIMVWLASNEKSGYAIMVSEGGTARPLSTDGLDFLFSHLKRPDDSFGFLCRIDGHIFYVLTFRYDNLTYVYDFRTNMFFTLTDENSNHFIAKRITFFNNKYYFVSFTDSKLYELSSLYTTYDGKSIPRGRILRPVRLDDGERFVAQNVTLTLEQGMFAPIQRVLLDVSRDGGESYQNYIANQLNVYGKRESLFQFWRLGMYNDMTLKFSFWSESRFVIIGGSLSIYR